MSRESRQFACDNLCSLNVHNLQENNLSYKEKDNRDFEVLFYDFVYLECNELLIEIDRNMKSNVIIEKRKSE